MFRKCTSANIYTILSERSSKTELTNETNWRRGIANPVMIFSYLINMRISSTLPEKASVDHGKVRQFD